MPGPRCPGMPATRGNQPARGRAAPGRTYSAGTGDAMAQPAEFVIGADATCSDGPCGQVTRVVVNPVAEAVTHLVVEPKHPHGLSRLVPLDLVEGGPHEVRLRCTRAEFEQLDSAEETQFSPELGGYSAYGPGEVLTWPYYGLGGGAGLRRRHRRGWARRSSPRTPCRRAKCPSAAATRVYATDGPIGRVQGLVIDPAQPPRHPRAAPGRPPVGTQGRGHPHRQREEERRGHHAEHHEGAGQGPAFGGYRPPAAVARRGSSPLLS